jgi:beta-lactamase class D
LIANKTIGLLLATCLLFTACSGITRSGEQVHAKNNLLSSPTEKTEDLSKYFAGYEGTFLLYDMKQREYTIYNQAKSEKRLAPNSIFKITNSLIGLETHILQDENTKFTWDTTIYSNEPWNRDHTLSSAFAYSVLWYYQTVAAKVGKTKMQKYLSQRLAAYADA